MKKLLPAMLGCIAIGAFSGGILAQSKGDLEIEKPWARATVPGAAVGGGDLVIRNKGASGDRLVGASSMASARGGVHESAGAKDGNRSATGEGGK